MYDLLGLAEPTSDFISADVVIELDPVSSTNPPPPPPTPVAPVIVTAPRASGWSSPFTGNGENSGNGVGSDPYAGHPDLQLEDEASAWASNHINSELNLSDPAHLAWYIQTHTILANIYFMASKYPNAVIDGPNARNFPAHELLNMLEDTNHPPDDCASIKRRLV